MAEPPRLVIPTTVSAFTARGYERNEMTPEGKLKQEVTKFLAGSGLHYLRLNSGIVKVRGGFMHLCPEGTADFVVFCPGPQWIELKAPGQKTAKTRAQKQREFAEKVQAMGHRHIQATSLDQVVDFVVKGVAP